MLMELKQDKVRNQADRGEDYNTMVVQHSSERSQKTIQVSLQVQGKRHLEYDAEC